MGMNHTTTIVKGILLDERFDDADVCAYAENNDSVVEYFGTGEYCLKQGVIGYHVIELNEEHHIFSLQDMDTNIDEQKLLSLVNTILITENIDAKFTNKDIKFYAVPFYG